MCAPLVLLMFFTVDQSMWESHNPKLNLNYISIFFSRIHFKDLNSGAQNLKNWIEKLGAGRKPCAGQDVVRVAVVAGWEFATISDISSCGTWVDTRNSLLDFSLSRIKFNEIELFFLDQGHKICKRHQKTIVSYAKTFCGMWIIQQSSEGQMYILFQPYTIKLL